MQVKHSQEGEEESSDTHGHVGGPSQLFLCDW